MDIMGVVVSLVRDKMPGYVNAKPYDIQVLTPMRKGELGVERLNSVLQKLQNISKKTFLFTFHSKRFSFYICKILFFIFKRCFVRGNPFYDF